MFAIKCLLSSFLVILAILLSIYYGLGILWTLDPHSNFGWIAVVLCPSILFLRTALPHLQPLWSELTQRKTYSPRWARRFFPWKFGHWDQENWVTLAPIIELLRCKSSYLFPVYTKECKNNSVCALVLKPVFQIPVAILPFLWLLVQWIIKPSFALKIPRVGLLAFLTTSIPWNRY